jgi:predicted enzyme related to lactoylglutathione lyase
MPTANLIILYVDNPPASERFYSELLDLKPIESSPTFAMFKLDSALMLGLWSRHTVEPGATAGGGGTEICFNVKNDDAVDQHHMDWRRRGITILQPPTTMDFGRTFVAIDPDGHRLRVYTPM